MYQGTTEKTCIRCGNTFPGGTNQTCGPCRTTDRQCITCGKQFRGRSRKCYDCRASDRPCKICGVVFHGINRTCTRCISGKTGCQMPECTEPKLRGRGQKYCTQHSAEGPQRERAQLVRRARERQYGLTHGEYLALLEAQGGACAICGDSAQQRALAVDHDHVTSAIRGLLCDRCNPMLGYARDSIAILEAAIEYLKRNQVLIPPHCV
jgi:Recombination endonuclease VII